MGSKNNIGVKPRRRSGCSQDYSVRNEAKCMTGQSMVTTALSWPIFQPLLLVPSSVHLQSKEPRRTDSWGSVSSHMLRQTLAPDEWGGSQSPQAVRRQHRQATSIPRCLHVRPIHCSKPSLNATAFRKLPLNLLA